MMKKKWIALLMVLLCVAVVFAGCQAEDPIRQVRIDVDGIFCGGCEGRAVEALEAVGVTVLDISAADDFVEVEFDSDEISLEEVKAVLTEQGLEIQ